MTSTEFRPTRRTLVRGAAWSIPVVSVAATAPAFAASSIVCPTLPASSGWTTTSTPNIQPNGSGGFSWGGSPSTFDVYRDNPSTTAPQTFTTVSPAMTVVAGATYTGTFSFFWGYGNGNIAQSTGGTFEILFDGVVNKSLTTRTAAVDSNATSAGVQPGTTTQSFSYVVPAGTTSTQVTYRYVLPARTLQACDDISVGRLIFNTCSVN